MWQLLARFAIALTEKGRRDGSGAEQTLGVHDLWRLSGETLKE